MNSNETELVELWRRAIDPSGVGMAEALAEDLGSYTGESVAEVLEKMAAGTNDLKRRWEEMKVDAKDDVQLASFYRNQMVEAYELAEWHSGRLNGVPPLNYAHAARLAKLKGARRVLDFGSGIGSGALCLSQAGCEVDCADISNTLLGFVRHRFTRRRISLRTIDLGLGETPPGRTYDLITCFDVLEHVPDQQRQVKHFESYLRPGGYLVVNFMRNSAHPDRPMHISSAGDWLAMIRRTNLMPDWRHFIGIDTQAFVYQPWGRVRNMVASLTDSSSKIASADS